MHNSGQQEAIANIGKRCGEVGTLIHCQQDCNTIEALSKPVWYFFKMLNPDVPYVLGCLLQGLCDQEK